MAKKKQRDGLSKVDAFQAAVPFKRRPEHDFGGGFYSEWMSGQVKFGKTLVKYELLTGAGMGNPIMTITVTVAGKTHRWDADMSEVFKATLQELLRGA
jgi:hypothetical protein